MGREGSAWDSAREHVEGKQRAHGAREGPPKGVGLTVGEGRSTRAIPAVVTRVAASSEARAPVEAIIAPGLAGVVRLGSSVLESMRVSSGPGAGACTAGAQKGALDAVGELRPGAGVP